MLLMLLQLIFLLGLPSLRLRTLHLGHRILEVLRVQGLAERDNHLMLLLSHPEDHRLRDGDLAGFRL